MEFLIWLVNPDFLDKHFLSVVTASALLTAIIALWASSRGDTGLKWGLTSAILVCVILIVGVIEFYTKILSGSIRLIPEGRYSGEDPTEHERTRDDADGPAIVSQEPGFILTTDSRTFELSWRLIRSCFMQVVVLIGLISSFVVSGLWSLPILR